MAAALTAVLTVIGVVYVTFFSDTFIGPFQGFLTTLGVPMAVWAGMFIVDVLLRKRDYDAEALYDAKGIYGAWNVKALAILAVGTFVGWGLVVNTAASWLTWQGYLLGPLGGKEGNWASANLGVIVALVIGLIGAAIPLTLLYFLYNSAVQYILTRFNVLQSFMNGLLPVNQVFRLLLPVGLILGMGIGLVGSLFTIRKHLKV